MLNHRGYPFLTESKQARLCYEKGCHYCQRMASLCHRQCLQDLRRLGLLDTWPKHSRTHYQQYQRDI